jgi:ubiquitin carboxyl-terminal hydrolase 7
VARNGNISDLLLGLQKRAGLDDETVQDVRIFEAYSGKVYKELNEKYSVAGITEFVEIYAERIPAEELNMQEGDFKINAFNFDREPSKTHGIPFKFVARAVSVNWAHFPPS